MHQQQIRCLKHRVTEVMQGTMGQMKQQTADQRPSCVMHQ